MPRFFFHVHDDDITLDREGMDLVDIAAARQMALKEARHLACDGVLLGHIRLEDRIDVHNEAGDLVVSVEFRDAIDVH